MCGIGMYRHRVLTLSRGLRRIRPSYFAKSCIILMAVAVVVTKEFRQFLPGVLKKARVNNTSTLLVSIAMKKDFNRSSLIAPSFSKTVEKFQGDTPNIPWRGNCSDDFKSRHLMTVFIYGRTGNQLFQICTLIAAADDACYSAFLSQKAEVSINSTFDIKNVLRVNVDESKSNMKVIGERGWSKYGGPLANAVDPDKNITLSGHLQSFKYFQHKKELVKSSLVFRNQVVVDVLNFFTNNSLQNKTKIGIHVRRGDFTWQHLTEFGFKPSNKEFLLKATRYFRQKLPNADLAFIVASNDIKWCEENIKSDDVFYSPFTDPGRDLHILTHYDHNVVTAGTFGWMGAWLNETGTVVYDKSFPRNQSSLWKGHRTQDYYPPWWIGL